MNKRLRLALSMLATITIAMFAISAAHAAPGGKGGGKPGGESCTDQFPSFTYTKPGKRKSTTVQLFLSSSGGCRTVKLTDIDARRGPALSYNNGRGLIAWIEDGSGYALWILRFVVDPDDGSVAITTEPELVLNAEQPVLNGFVEYFFGVDVSTDYSDLNAPIETVSLESWLDFAGDGSGALGTEIRIKLVDLLSCGAVCDVEIPISSTLDGALACMGSGPFDPFAPDGEPNWRCLIANSRPTFSASGDALYYRIDEPAIYTAGDWKGTARIQRPVDGWTSGTYPDPDLVFLNTGSGSIPAAGHALRLDASASSETLVSDACFGMSGGIGDCRLYFLNVAACMSDPAGGWSPCQVLYSGEIAGRYASWRNTPDGGIEVIYSGWGSPDFDTVRAFDPTLDPTDNDRQIISDGENPDSGL